jgi:hypothetical protein
MKMYGGGCITPGILNLGTRWRLVVSFTSLPLYSQENSLLYQLYRRLGGPKGWSAPYEEKKSLLPLPGIEH